MNRPSARPATPEWVVGQRLDRRLDPSLPGGWSVSDAPPSRGFASTDFGRHAMFVPAGSDLLARAVRAHELIHAGISPSLVPGELLATVGVSTQAITLAEEIRVNATLRRHGNDISGDGMDLWKYLVDGSEKKAAAIAVESKSWTQALSVLLSTCFTGASTAVKRKLNTVPEWREPIQEIGKVLDRHFGRGARRVSMWEHNDTRPVELNYAGARGEQRSSIMPRGFYETTLPLAIAIQDWLGVPPSSSASGYTIKGEQTPDIMSGRWDSIRLGATNLTEQTGKFIGKRRRPAITGKHLKRPDRLLTDPERRVFTEEVRGQGGVVVFDCSGSMSIEHRHVESILNSFSGATIIAYANHDNAANTWILAKNGRMVSRAEFKKLPLHGGNGIDAPVVAWAAKQRRSNKDFLIWISDGEVTGLHDRQTDDLFDDMARVIRKYGVTNVRHEQEAVELVRSIRNGRPVPRAHSHHRRLRRKMNP